MIPLWLTLHVRTRRGTTVKLGLPLFLIWLAALPFAILLAPLVMVACVLIGLNPLAPFVAFWSLMRSVRETHIEVESPQSFVFMHVY